MILQKNPQSIVPTADLLLALVHHVRAKDSTVGQIVRHAMAQDLVSHVSRIGDRAMRTPKPGDLYRARIGSGSGLYEAGDLLSIRMILNGGWVQLKIDGCIVDPAIQADNLEMVDGAWQRKKETYK
jgi:hypothetical protein